MDHVWCIYLHLVDLCSTLHHPPSHWRKKSCIVEIVFQIVVDRKHCMGYVFILAISTDLHRIWEPSTVTIHPDWYVCYQFLDIYIYINIHFMWTFAGSFSRSTLTPVWRGTPRVAVVLFLLRFVLRRRRCWERNWRWRSCWWECCSMPMFFSDLDWVVVSNIFMFTPTWGWFPIWLIYFSNGLKPPTRWWIGWKVVGYGYWLEGCCLPRSLGVFLLFCGVWNLLCDLCWGFFFGSLTSRVMSMCENSKACFMFHLQMGAPLEDELPFGNHDFRVWCWILGLQVVNICIT